MHTKITKYKPSAPQETEIRMSWSENSPHRLKSMVKAWTAKGKVKAVVGAQSLWWEKFPVPLVSAGESGRSPSCLTNFSSGLHLDTWEEGYKNSNVLKNLPTKYAVRGFIRLIFEKKLIFLDLRKGKMPKQNLETGLLKGAQDSSIMVTYSALWSPALLAATRIKN